MTSLLLAALLAAPDAGAVLSRPVEVTAEKLEVLNKEQRAVYSGRARAVRDSTTLTCDRLEVLYGANREVTRILARGNVEAVDGDRWARGDEADFDNQTGVLVVRGSPQARQGKREVAGDEVTFTTGVDRLVVTKARTRVEDEQAAGAEQRVLIDADTLTLESARNQAVWRGHVRARRGATTLTAPELTAFYEEDGTVTRVEARGGVEATEKDRWARGQRAVYEVKPGVLVVTGKPEAKQGRNRMRGTKVTFKTGSDVVEVENAVTVLEVERKPK